MTATEDRRAPVESQDPDFTPEYLAVLVVCGGRVRDSDWAVLPETLAARRARLAAPDSSNDAQAPPPA